ncbi:hypothetical protein BDW60DRAFT_178699, partial [Aspergillus nidulans var. acristatus]
MPAADEVETSSRLWFILMRKANRTQQELYLAARVSARERLECRWALNARKSEASSSQHRWYGPVVMFGTGTGIWKLESIGLLIIMGWGVGRNMNSWKKWELATIQKLNRECHQIAGQADLY